MSEITKIKIFPAIGIMRVGNSPEYFIGPEIPGKREPPEGGYKDAHCRIKRQAARFRLYGYDKDNNLVKDGTGKPLEINMNNAALTWKVHLANKKASWKKYYNPKLDIIPDADRNPEYFEIKDAQKKHLEIDPGERDLSGKNQVAKFDTGEFAWLVGNQVTFIKVPLGEMRTDEDGRLLVLGGFGRSEGWPGFALKHETMYDNSGWYDDVSDGPVTASVTIDGQQITADPAWVICGPPDYAPSIDTVTTLYDVLYQRMRTTPSIVDPKIKLIVDPEKKSYARHIYPILKRVLDHRAVQNKLPNWKGAHSSFLNIHDVEPGPARESIFERLRDPANPGDGTGADEFFGPNMPRLLNDDKKKNFAVTPWQYECIQVWASASTDPSEPLPYDHDWPPQPPDTIPDDPEELTRAALEACVGGGFHPGVEAGWFLRDEYDYTEAFRLDHNAINFNNQKLTAGDITRQMALPWQGDFYYCKSEGTHAWWPAAHPDEVLVPETGIVDDWTRDFVSDPNSMVVNWNKLGFVVEKEGKLVETERGAVCANIFFVNDRSHFSQNEVEAQLKVGKDDIIPATFPDSFYIVAEGFFPWELGVGKGQPVTKIAPVIEFKVDGSLAQGIKATPQEEPLLEIIPPDPNQFQRVTFAYQIEFTNTNDFFPDKNRTVLVKATLTIPKADKTPDTYVASGILTLTHKPNPYMIDGPTSWLSEDVQVFKVIPGAKTSFGYTFEALKDETLETAAINFLHQVVDDFNKLADKPDHPFDKMLTEQEPEERNLEPSLKINDGKDFVFNFAVARVRYRGTEEAKGVRMFFRLFQTAATGLDYDVMTTYRRSNDSDDAISLLGVKNGKVVTIPCYGDPRVDNQSLKEKQKDLFNKQDFIRDKKSPVEMHRYFGCWLDINQTKVRFPSDVGQNPDGPWLPSDEPKSMQQLIKGHQCLVAEIYYNQDDPINQMDTPASSDNLAQRNLTIDWSDNPGSTATHTVQHTFEIKATNPKPQFVGLEGTASINELSLVAAGPDELMFRWNNLPRSTHVVLYMPDVSAEEVLNLARQSYKAVRLERIDAHTLRFLPGDVTYVPLPMGRKDDIAALMTLELPDSIKYGEAFQVVMRQVSGLPRTILGAFEFYVPVRPKSVLLEPEMRKLSVLRHIFRSIRVDDQWYPIFVRLLDTVADRVRGFGGDPDAVAPSPDGSGVKTAQHCIKLGWLLSLALALFVVLAGLHPVANYLPEIIIAAFLLIVLVLWAVKCGSSVCRLITASLVGLGFGAAVLALFLLAGFSAQQGLVVLALAALFFGAVVIAGLISGCLSFSEKQP